MNLTRCDKYCYSVLISDVCVVHKYSYSKAQIASTWAEINY